MGTKYMHLVDFALESVARILVIDMVFAAVLFPFIFLVTFLLRKRNLTLVYGMWLLVLIRLILPPDVATPVSIGNLLHPAAWLPVNLHTANAAGQPDRSPGGYPSEREVSVASKTAERQERTVQPPGRRFDVPNLLWPVRAAVIVWLAGVVLTLLYFNRSRAFFRRIAASSAPVTDGCIGSMVDRLRRRFGIRRRVNVLCSADCPAPFTIGAVKPVIVLPAGLVSKGDRFILKAVCAHEMAHIKRWDDLFVRAQLMLQSVYFFYPVVWYANRKLFRTRESICDDMAVRQANLPVKRYANAIVTVLRLGCAGRSTPSAMPGFGMHKKMMKQRLHHILEGNPMKKPRKAVLALLICMTGLFLLPMAPYALQAQNNEQGMVLRSNRLLNQMEGWFARIFDPGYHTRSQLPGELRSGFNPHINLPLKQSRSFHTSIEQQLAPGIEYATGGRPVRAAAAGIVLFIGETKPGPGRSGGYYVRVVHDFYDHLKKDAYPRMPLYRNQVYRSSYYHLSKVLVTHWQSVRRGDPIGYGMRNGSGSGETFTLVLEERGNWVDPDQYGFGHACMLPMQANHIREMPLEEMNARLDRQQDIVARINAFYSKREHDDIFKKTYGQVDTEKFKHYPLRWSTVDRFKYLGMLYAKQPELFPGLDQKTFASLSEAFKDNQAIFLTLPFY